MTQQPTQPAAPASEPQQAKLSVIVPRDLADRLDELAREDGVSVSDVVRAMLEHGAQSRRPGAARAFLIEPGDLVRRGVELAAGYLDVPPEAVIRQLLAENLAPLLEDAMHTAGTLEVVVEEAADPAQPEPTGEPEAKATGQVRGRARGRRAVKEDAEEGGSAPGS